MPVKRKQTATKGKSNRGRRTTLTPEVQLRIIEAILAGNYFDTACRYAGVAPSTAYEWIARGNEQSERSAEPHFVEFAEAIARANAQVEVQAVATLRRHGQKDARALMEFLMRRFPERWGNKPIEQEASNEVDATEILTEIAQSMRARMLAQKTGVELER